MRKVRVFSNIVQEVIDADPFPPFHPDLVWVETATGNEGDGYDGINFIPNPGNLQIPIFDGTAWIEGETSQQETDRLTKDARRQRILVQLSGLSDVQIDNYIDSNVTDLAGQIAYNKRLTKVLRDLAIEVGA